MEDSPKRTLRLTSPLTHGEDVRRLQVAINARARDRRVDTDGEYGPATAHAAKVTFLALGGATHALDNGVGLHAQIIIRAPNRRTPVELFRARARAKAAAQRGEGAAGVVALALKLARQSPHITENPAGSNTDRGGLIDQAQAECGIHGTYYCGAGAHYLLKHGGGIEVSTGIVYCPTTEALAKSGTGGFKEWIPVARAREAPVGSLALFDEGGIAGHVEVLVERITTSEAHTVGWNTSSGDGGSQSNGGGVFERDRPLGGGFPIRGFAVPRGL